MSRLAIAIALIAFGLGIGLWIGFNPQAHAAAQENVGRATQAFAQLRANADIWLGGLTSQDSAAQTATAQAQQAPSDDSSEGLDLQGLWKATQRVWLSVLSRISIKS